MKKLCAGFVVAMIAARWSHAQSPSEIRTMHDQAVANIRMLSSRSLTPGDTFFTWNTNTVSLVHTVATTEQSTRNSLLRADGMIGTADVQWTNQRPTKFDIEWTTRDAATGRPKPSFEAHGTLVGDSLQITGSQPRRVVRVPKGLWAVADYGMEENLIPLLIASKASAAPRSVTVLRPWVARWDTVTFTIRDTASLRIVQLRGSDKSNELLVLNARGELLCGIRLDAVNERRPLEGSSRYAEFAQRRPFLEALATKYRQGAAAPN